MKNLVILVALQKDASLRPTWKILLRNLTITDLCAGLISQPLAMTIFLSLITENWTLCRKAKNSAYIVTTVFFGVSLATLTSIAVERLLALFLGIRYGLLALEYDIIPPFKRSIDDIRADDFNAFLLQNILHHSTSINASAE